MSGVVIYGSGGHARELAFQMERDKITVLAFADDQSNNRLLNGVSVLSREQALMQFPGVQWMVGIGSPAIRSRILTEIGAVASLGSYISSASIIAGTSKIGDLAQIFANSIVSDGCRIGRNVIVNFGCVISHDVEIGENTTICPNVAIAGNVVVGNDVWVGIGTTFKNGTPNDPILIGDGALIGAGSVVTKSIASKSVVAGVPAREIIR